MRLLKGYAQFMNMITCPRLGMIRTGMCMMHIHNLKRRDSHLKRIHFLNGPHCAACKQDGHLQRKMAITAAKNRVLTLASKHTFQVTRFKKATVKSSQSKYKSAQVIAVEEIAYQDIVKAHACCLTQVRDRRTRIYLVKAKVTL